MRNVVTFVANDKVLHYLRPFLESFRAHMPSQEAVMISYDGNDAQARALAQTYNVRVIDSSVSHPEISGLSEAIYGKFHGHFRKLEAFYVESDCTMMIDVDVVVACDFKPVFDIFRSNQLDFLYGERTSQYVYSQAGLAHFPESELFSTGFLFFDAKKHPVASIMQHTIGNIAEYKTFRNQYVHDQPLLNYYVDKKGLKCRNLDSLSDRYTGENFYAGSRMKVTWEKGEPQISAGGKQALMLHFAGLKTIEGDFRFKEVITHYQKKADARS
ncbi:hypothetical protein E0493_16240 [Roseomonas sp. M0104]|uniref:Nucleotide-diphospho-sugar transferase domain-containing protein n=1 Tax=Teichococcus coralli TaxID=2545983 RepID=A0A845BI85_9PROT|nr:glycosyltransferase [Pseudoroseomonas coralli]MXP64902.1 hypothetical protein [Pseudoroseomonas coralli]